MCFSSSAHQLLYWLQTINSFWANRQYHCHSLAPAGRWTLNFVSLYASHRSQASLLASSGIETYCALKLVTMMLVVGTFHGLTFLCFIFPVAAAVATSPVSRNRRFPPLLLTWSIFHLKGIRTVWTGLVILHYNTIFRFSRCTQISSISADEVVPPPPTWGSVVIWR